MPVRAGAVEQYKRAFARQRARDLAQHADTLLCKDKQIASLQHECRQLEAQLRPGKVLDTHNTVTYTDNTRNIHKTFITHTLLRFHDAFSKLFQHFCLFRCLQYIINLVAYAS